MSIKKVKKEFTVWLIEDYNSEYKGSCLHVDKESKYFYYGIHSSMWGSFHTKFPKEKCTKKNPLQFPLIDESKLTAKQKKERNKLLNKALEVTLKAQKSWQNT